MKYGRALWFSVLAYALMFFIGVTTMRTFGIRDFHIEAMTPLAWSIIAASSLMVAVIFSLWYFRLLHVTASLWHGFVLGFIMIFTAIVLDLVDIALSAVSGGDFLVAWAYLLDYYSQYAFWAVVVLVLSITSWAGWHKGAGRIF